MTNEQKLALLANTATFAEFQARYFGQDVPEWQRKAAENMADLMDRCGPDEEIRLVSHPRGHYMMWNIVKKGKR